MDAVLKYWPLLALAINALAVWVMWSIRTGLATKQEMSAMRESVMQSIGNVRDEFHRHWHDLEHRMTEQEQITAQAPTHADLAQIHTRINTVAGDLKLLIGTSDGVRKIVDLIHEHLMSEGKG